ncbi:hypothetical protein RJ53_02635 [Methanocalculus chunghsingensis]|uniref:NADH:quinone oxidoreductase/Mrp antiporter transmembrane domain-containing protein n=1 Tax=Methanocalculus chunghsingensis TaxID=156457 RepID=A0A8J8B6B1_9EURY|nr:proton-conducting transporter membrane subunit [Methanocalculus chunghsingensis]MBR1368457.1 hypothetical protein [Methanocalculus chunghsingensis]
MATMGFQPEYAGIALLAVPFIGSFLCYFMGRYSPPLRNLIAVSAPALVLLIAGLGIPSLSPDLSLRIAIENEYLFYTPVIQINPFSYVVILVTAFVWMLGTVYATGYLGEEERTNRFYAFWLFSFFADLGVLISGDYITLYLFFELLTLSAFVLIIHYQTHDAVAAAKKYLFLGISGAFLILAGAALLYAGTGSVDVAPLAVGSGLTSSQILLIAGLMILGFGVKAGMYPVHIWLPDAHSSAPTPASAILSGLIIKVGAYGIFVVCLFILLPSVISGSLSSSGSPAGLVLIWLSLITMIVAVFLALMQTNSKRMLAYHSISQMGFILLGISCVVYLGDAGSTGFAGGLYHLINHALFKASLFLAVGAVFLATDELNMYKIGGIWRSMPFTAVAMAIGVCAISGIPGFNGFVSKAFIHHALIDAQALGGWTLLPAEAIFFIVCGGTVASTGKLLLFTFFGETKLQRLPLDTTPIPMRAALFALSVAIILLGILPGLAIFFILPAAMIFPFSESGITYIAGYAGYGGAGIYSAGNIGYAILEVSVGILLFIAYVFWGWFHWEKKVPSLISPDAWYYRATGAFHSTGRFVGIDLLSGIQEMTRSADERFQERWHLFSRRHRRTLMNLSTFGTGILLITLVLGIYLIIIILTPFIGW